MPIMNKYMNVGIYDIIMNPPNGMRSPHSPDSSSSSSSCSQSHLCLYSNGNSPMSNQAVSPSSHHGYLSGTPPGVGTVPRLRILNQPQKKFRFRYFSEMTGTHGCLMGETKERNKKEYIRVMLEGCQEREAIIRCTLVTNSSQPDFHVHRLSREGNGNGDCQDIVVSQTKNEWIACFSGLTIIHTAKRNVRDVIVDRMFADVKKRGINLNHNEERQLRDKADSLATTMDLHSVKLKFEALVEINGREELLCPPVYSTEIQNLKSTQAGDLRIVRIDKVCSCCTGQEEIFIFVEKVNKKDIKVRFFEMDEDNSEVLWEDFAEFSELDVHHQYAIAFKTPAYRDQNIKKAVNVQLQLYRPSNGTFSEPRGFTYTPREEVRVGHAIKRRIPIQRDDYPGRLPPSHQPTNGTPVIYENHPAIFSGGQTNQGPSGNYSTSHQGIIPTKGPMTSNIATANILDVKPVSWNLPQPQQFPVDSGHGQNLQEWSTIRQVPQLPGGSMAQAACFGTESASMVALVSELNRVIDNQIIDDQLSQFLQCCFGPSDHYSQTEPLMPMPVSQSSQQPLQPPSPVRPMQTGFNIEAIDNPQHEDPLLAGLLESGSWMSANDEEYVFDASCTADQLANKIGNLQIGNEEDAMRNDQSHVPHRDMIKPNYIGLINAQMFSNYSLNMACALRHYVETGDLPHILRRMIHLLAMQSDEGNNALHEALYHNQMDVVRSMLKAAAGTKTGLDFVNAQNNANQTPLHISVTKNQTEAVALLLQTGADPVKSDLNGNTPIHIAASDSHLVDCLQLLLSPPKVVSKLNERNYSGLTPLHIAVNAKNLKSVEYLVAKGADVNCHEAKRGRTALHIAVKKQARDIVAFLLQKTNVNVNQQSYDGNTALHLAVMDNLEEMCNLLLNFGADESIENYLRCQLSDSNTESDEESDEEKSDIRGQRPFDIAHINPQLLKIFEERKRFSSAKAVSNSTLSNSEMSTTQTEKTALDSGIDLMASKDLTREIDDAVIEELARWFDNPTKDWEKLADKLDIDLSSMRIVFDKQPSPTRYLLKNLDLWDVTPLVVLDKMRQLHFQEAATILENHIHQ